MITTVACGSSSSVHLCCPYVWSFSRSYSLLLVLQICRQVLCDVCVNDPDVYKFLKFFMYLLSLKHLLDGERLFELALSLYIQELYGANCK